MKAGKNGENICGDMVLFGLLGFVRDWHFLPSGWACVLRQPFAGRGKLFIIFPGGIQGNSAVFVAGFVIGGYKNIVFPETDRADIGDSLAWGNRQSYTSAAWAGVFSLRLRSAKLFRVIGAVVIGCGQIFVFHLFLLYIMCLRQLLPKDRKNFCRIPAYPLFSAGLSAQTGRFCPLPDTRPVPVG